MNEIRPLLEKAEEDIRAAEVLMKENFNRIAVSRLYYAMFYVTEALLL
ncbi:MAG: HEPN domain-containing protein, partial [Elusimicrobiota bacterium]|nr:HEPN domain-containing protein [Elusimicrobiota bacterium]